MDEFNPFQTFLWFNSVSQALFATDKLIDLWEVQTRHLIACFRLISIDPDYLVRLVNLFQWVNLVKDQLQFLRNQHLLSGSFFQAYVTGLMERLYPIHIFLDQLVRKLHL